MVETIPKINFHYGNETSKPLKLVTICNMYLEYFQQTLMFVTHAKHVILKM